MVLVQTNPYQPTAPTSQSDPTAVMGRRIGAWLVDSVIAVIVFTVAMTRILDKLTLPNSQAASDLCELVNASPENNICISIGSTVYGGTGGDMGSIFLVLLAFFAIFHVLLPTLTGFSPGKGVFGLRIVKQDTFQTAGFGANLVRWLLWIVDSFPFIVPLVGFITGLASKGHRRVGDMAASTIVVNKASVGSPVPIPGFGPPAVGGVPTSVAPPPPGNWAAPPPVAAPPVAAPPVSAPPVAAPPPPTPSTFAPPTPVDSEPEPDSEVTPDEDAVELTAPDPEPEPAPEPETAPEPEPAVDAAPGVDGPQWDAARNTYIQWDPELAEWMEWSEGQGKWVSISR